ncbi:hypothetical protein GOP47_0025146 [Adiantum capillus-veneris]|uniref:Uncharacterized protein n=1 Tax=Adiantum capillus-veneris TaxID=13818 RepID=A0A9D4U349_ADICA|nr:hypothetical protein GOP47_0025146 [Adiantum capillus-veneris]
MNSALMACMLMAFNRSCWREDSILLRRRTAKYGEAEWYDGGSVQVEYRRSFCPELCELSRLRLRRSCWREDSILLRRRTAKYGEAEWYDGGGNGDGGRDGAGVGADHGKL